MWISSLLVHAAILLLICWWAAIPHLLPPGQAAVEVSLVGAIPGGEGAPGNAETAARHGHAPLRAGDRQAGASLPAAARSAAVTSAPPPPSGRQTEGKAEGPRPAIEAPSVMDRVGAQEAADVPLASETTGGRAADSAVEQTAKALRGELVRSDSDASELTGEAGQQGSPDVKGDGAVLSGGVGTGATEHGGVVGAGAGFGSTDGAGGGPGQGSGSGRGGMDWRQLLRDRIERAKQYPSDARRQGMEGTTEVQFQVAKDGSVKEVMVVRSSGFPILDHASVETIKRAAPLPFVPGTIRLPITYRLREAR
ncbi:MAG: energy transducer TonB, partial [Acidobacteria bacterium]|nr:energy transducer TonB [Acidobacteriota bacterium]